MLHEVTILILSTSIIQGIVYIVCKNKNRDDSFVGLCIFAPLSSTIVFSFLRFLQEIWPQVLDQIRKDLGYEPIRKSKKEALAKEKYETPIVLLLVLTFFLFSMCVTINTFKEDNPLMDSATSAYDYYGTKTMSNNVWFESSGLQKVFTIINLAIFSFLIVNILLQSIGVWNVKELYATDDREVSNTTSTILKFTLTFLLHVITRAYHNIFNVSCSSKALDAINSKGLLQSTNVLYLEMGSTVSSQVLLAVLFGFAVFDTLKKWNLSMGWLYFTFLYALSFNILLTICLFETVTKRQMDSNFLFIFILPIVVSIYSLDIYNFVVCRLKLESEDENNGEKDDSEWDGGEDTSKTGAAFPFSSFINAKHFLPRKSSRRFD